MTDLAGAAPSGQHSRKSEWSAAWRILRRDPKAMVGLVGLSAVLLTTILAPHIVPYDPMEMAYGSLRQPPSWEHIWGTDDLGRDILSRVIWGGRESLRVGLMAVTIAISGGVAVGVSSGYYGGALDFITQRLVEIAMAFPAILLMLSIVAALGPGLSTILIALGITWIPHYARLVRGSVLSAKEFEYVTAARAVGARHHRIMARHILPNILAPVIVYATLGLGSSIMLTAGLSYLGLGAQPPSPEWGAMLLYGRNYLREAWWMSVFPGLAIFFCVLFINLLGDGLRDSLDPRLRG